MAEVYIEYEVIKDLEGNSFGVDWTKLPIGTRFFAYIDGSGKIGGEDVVYFRRSDNPTTNYYIPLMYLNEAKVIRIGGE